MEKGKVVRNIYNFKKGDQVRYYKEEDGRYFVFAKGKKRWGYRLNKEVFDEYFIQVLESEEQKEKKWTNSFRRIVILLEKSGLWKDILERTKELLSVGYKEFKNILKLSNNQSSIYDELNNHNIKPGDENYEEFVKKFNKSIYGEYIEKYPFLFNQNNSLNISEYEYGIPKIKTMYFGKWATAEERKRIQDHYENKVKYSTRAYVNYDISFEYNPCCDDGISRAWYSEEYKGCGNGHYYLALDNMHALFCEDD